MERRARRDGCGIRHRRANLHHPRDWHSLFVHGSVSGRQLALLVEEGARCASVRTTVCSDATTIVSYAQSRYFGPSSSPTFTYAAAACSNSVSGSINYVVDLGLKQITVPIAATCFP